MSRVRLFAIAGLAVILAACSDKQGPSQPTSEPPSTPQSTHGSLAECLQSHGVPETGGPAAVLGTVGPPAGVDQSTWDSAMKACSTLAPGPPGP